MKKERKKLEKIEGPFEPVEGYNGGSPALPKDESAETQKKGEDVVAPSTEMPSVGVTVAAFVLNDDHLTSGTEFGKGNANSEEVRNEIIKALKEEGENFD